MGKKIFRSIKKSEKSAIDTSTDHLIFNYIGLNFHVTWYHKILIDKWHKNKDNKKHFIHISVE